MKSIKLIICCFAALTLLATTAFAQAAEKSGKPKLILQITIDQMRGDFPMRYKDRLGKGDSELSEMAPCGAI